MNLTYLNERQKEAVLCEAQDVLVLAGAGTGKTRVLTAKVEYLLDKGVLPSQIACFTFTNKAAREMKWRISKSLGYDIAEKISISTFHSFCMRHLIMHIQTLGFDPTNLKIAIDSDINLIINKLVDEYKPTVTNQELKKYFSNIKNKVEIPNISLEKQSEILYLFNIYQLHLKESNRLDLDDIIYYFNQLLDDEYFLELMQDYNYILVDECQDTNPIQYEIITKMRGKYNNTFLTGDDDQCVYNFRGSDPFLVQKYINDYNPTKIILNQNYRSLPSIVEASTRLISKNNNRVEKDYETVRKKNVKFQIVRCNNNRSEGLNIASIINQYVSHGYEYKDIAVLYRNKSIIDHLEPYLLKENIPFNKQNKQSYIDSEEIAIIINYYRFLSNPKDDIALQNVLNHKVFNVSNAKLVNILNDRRKYNCSLFEALKLYDERIPDIKYFFDKYYLLNDEFTKYKAKDFYERLIQILELKEYYETKPNGNKSIVRIDNFKEFLEDLETNKDIIDFINNLALDNTQKQDANNKVEFMTIHQSKGLEFPIVIIPGLEEGILPSSKAKTPLQIEEERRICYVGITRAKDNCVLITNKKRFLYGKEQNQKESRFLLEILGEKL